MKRYSFNDSDAYWQTDTHGVIEDPNGRWVKYDDAIKNIRQLEKELATLRQLVKAKP